MPPTDDASKIYVGNLSKSVRGYDLEEIFSKYGKVTNLTLGGKGFGFVQYNNAESAKKAINKEHGRLLRGNNIGMVIVCLGRS